MKKIVKFLLITLLLLPMLGGWANAEQFKPATLINFKTGYRVAVYSDSQAQRYFSLGYELDKGLLGFSVVTNYSTTLSSSITATQTTIPVGTTKDKKGEQLATSTLGMKIYLNIEPGGNKEELVVCTGISGNNWTGCTRGLAFSGTDESAVSSYQYAHSAGSRVVMSNIHYVYQNFVDLDSNQTITGNKTFSGTANFTGGVSNFTNIPTTSTSTPTANNQIVTKGYVDGIVVAGGVTMSTTTPGIAKISSDPSNPLNPVVLNSEEVSATSGANKVVRASSSGYIDSSFINLNNQTFSRLNIGTSTTSINPNTIDIIAVDNFSTSTVPQAAFATTTGIVRTNSADINKVKFDGFVINNPTSTDVATLQTTGIVSGFTGLTVNSDYFVNGNGTISTTSATNYIRIGKAVSSTSLLITPLKLVIPVSGNYTSSGTSGTATTTIPVGFKPSKLTGNASVTAIGASASCNSASGSFTINYINGNGFSAMVIGASPSIGGNTLNIDAGSGYFGNYSLNSLGENGVVNVFSWKKDAGCGVNPSYSWNYIVEN